MQNQRHETKIFALQTFNVFFWHIIQFFVTFIFRIRIIVCFVFDVVFIIVRIMLQNNKMFNQRFIDEQIVEIDQIKNISFFFQTCCVEFIRSWNIVYIHILTNFFQNSNNKSLFLIAIFLIFQKFRHFLIQYKFHLCVYFLFASNAFRQKSTRRRSILCFLKITNWFTTKNDCSIQFIVFQSKTQYEIDHFRSIANHHEKNYKKFDYCIENKIRFNRINWKNENRNNRKKTKTKKKTKKNEKQNNESKF